jgi:hypothetical protein
MTIEVFRSYRSIRVNGRFYSREVSLPISTCADLVKHNEKSSTFCIKVNLPNLKWKAPALVSLLRSETSLVFRDQECFCPEALNFLDSIVSPGLWLSLQKNRFLIDK